MNINFISAKHVPLWVTPSGRQVVFENKKRTKCTHKKYIMYIKSIQNVHKMYIKKHIIL